MYAQLGNIRFEGAKGFTSLEETFAVNYAQHERIRSKPRLESVGDVLDTISFGMYLHSEFTDPEADIEALRVAMKNREILTLILGNGKVVGNFVIPSFTKSTSFTDGAGNIIEATISVELLESFSEDPLQEAQKQAVNSAFATSQRNSNVRSVLPPKQSEGMSVSQDVSNIQATGIQVGQQVSEIDRNPSALEYYSGKINEGLDKIEGYITTVRDKIQNVEELTGLSTGMPEALDGLYSRIQDIKAILPAPDISNLKIMNVNFQNAITVVKKSTTLINNQSIIRRV